MFTIRDLIYFYFDALVRSGSFAVEFFKAPGTTTLKAVFNALLITTQSEVEANAELIDTSNSYQHQSAIK